MTVKHKWPIIMFNGVHFSLNAYNMQGVLKSRAQCV